MSGKKGKRRGNQFKFKNMYHSKVFIGVSIIVLVFIFILCSVGVILYTDIFYPKIFLSKGKENIGSSITVNYKSKYQEPEYKATFHNKDITKKVKIVGEVNTKKIGDYKVTYQIKEKGKTSSRVLVVKVRDISAPHITLSGSKTADVCPGGKYQEEGYQAIDNLDGDITKKVKVHYNKEEVIYQVTDKAGNEKKIIRKLVYQDKTPPTITLKGFNYETIYVGEEFKDPGVEAVDLCDKDLAKEVNVSGTIDNKKTGKYELEYSVTDEAGNKASIKRTVQVVEHGQNGTIYLTFDDGPKRGTTDVILDILKEENVKATFFITNSGPDDLVVREYQEGHTVALHTASHDYSYVYSSVENYYNDLYTVRDRVKRLTGQDANIIRFPGGASNTISRRYSNGIMSTLTRDVLQKGFRYYDWNLSSGDAGEYSTADEIYNQVTSHLSKDRVNIVLMHDIKTYTRDALRRIIQYGKENGYNFDQITENTEMMTQRVNN